jgi:hypothetical protein
MIEHKGYYVVCARPESESHCCGEYLKTYLSADCCKIRVVEGKLLLFELDCILHPGTRTERHTSDITLAWPCACALEAFRTVCFSTTVTTLHVKYNSTFSQRLL